jgi:hypothetical protein
MHTYGESMQARGGPSKEVNPCHARGGEEGGYQVVGRQNIYPVPHSELVSPIHCVPKKGGLTVVKNEKNELIL